ncbi:MAG: Mut7-C RNAse domain-containing protein [Myxococcota bacterium]
MAVPCPSCGREYDVALFSFGRTIHCTCGTRVGVEPRVEHRPAQEPRFMVDAMLGRLARWLRVLGYDSAYQADIDDEHLVRRALDENRVILTRDRALAEEWRVPSILVLRTEAPLEQLRQVAGRMRLDWRGRLFRRCSVCNAPLTPAAPEQVAGRVPARVLRELRRFVECRSCGRVYWEGSHTARMRSVLEETLGE